MEWPENWDRSDVIEFLEKFIKTEKGGFRIRVTSVGISDFFGKTDFFVNYEVYYTTSKWEKPNPSTFFGGMCEWKKHLRDKNIDIING